MGTVCFQGLSKSSKNTEITTKKIKCNHKINPFNKVPNITRNYLKQHATFLLCVPDVWKLLHMTLVVNLIYRFGWSKQANQLLAPWFSSAPKSSKNRETTVSFLPTARTSLDSVELNHQSNPGGGGVHMAMPSVWVCEWVSVSFSAKVFPHRETRFEMKRVWNVPLQTETNDLFQEVTRDFFKECNELHYF